MISENSGDIVLTNGEYLSKYSSEVIKKGLSLAKQKRLQNNISKHSGSNSKVFQCLYKIRLPMREDGQKKLSPNGKILATADRWGIVNIWNVSDGDLIRSLDLGYEQKPLPGESLFYNSSIDNYNEYKNKGANYSIEFLTKTEELVGINPESRKITIWNYITGKKTWEYDYYFFDRLNINNDQVIDRVDDFPSGSIARIINLDTKLILYLENDEIGFGLNIYYCFSKQSNILAISGDKFVDCSDCHENDNDEEWYVYENSIKIVNLETNLLLHTLDEYVYKFEYPSNEGMTHDLPSIKISNNGKFLISIDYYLTTSYEETSYKGTISQLKVWDTESGKIVYYSRFDDCLCLEMLEISSNGKLIIYDDSKIEVIDIYSQKRQYFDCSGSYCLHESSKVFLIAETNDNKIQIWNLENGNLIFTLADNKIVKTISYGNDEKNLVSQDNNDNKIKLWNLENGDCVQMLSEYRSEILAIELIDNGETFMYIDNGEEIEIWKLSYLNESIVSKSVKCNTQKMIDSLIQIGDDRYNSSNYDGAINSYTKSINIDHDNADAYNKRSTARSANGDIEGAVEDLQKAQQLLRF
jgi:WD40 repeat protein